MIHKIILILLFVCISLGVYSQDIFATQRKHIIAYGGIKNKYLSQIAANCNILIVEILTKEQMHILKSINPSIIILKYYDALMTHENNPNWKNININENWFAHDSITGSRMKHLRFGGYLMNLSSPEWRSCWVNMVNNTPDYFDGVFIDDCWERYINKFSEDHTMPNEKSISENWENNIVLLLEKLKESFKGLLIINGIFEKYLQVADGCMEENFLHSNLDSDVSFKSASYVYRSLTRIEKLKQQGKLLLLQSGTLGDKTDEAIKKVYNYCFYAYQMVSGNSTSFGFQPARGYYFTGLYNGLVRNEPIWLEMPSSKFTARQIDSPNTQFDNKLALDWKLWKRAGSNKKRDISEKDYIHLVKGVESDQEVIEISSIPVKPLKSYILSFWLKARAITPGNYLWKSMSLHCRFHDSDYIPVSGKIIKFLEQGTYDWSPFEILLESPEKAEYLEMKLGFIMEGSGDAWVRDIYLGTNTMNYFIFHRSFSGGEIIFNPNRLLVQINNKIDSGSEPFNVKSFEGVAVAEEVGK